MVDDYPGVLVVNAAAGEHALKENAQGVVGVLLGLTGHLRCKSFGGRAKGCGGRLYGITGIGTPRTEEGITLTLALSHRGRGDKTPPRSTLRVAPASADLRQGERPHWIPDWCGG